MKTEFIKKGELKLVNGGYVSNKEGRPINNAQFITAQKHAEYVVTFAKAAKGKNFKEQEVDCLETLKREVYDSLTKKNKVEYVKMPEEVKRTTHDKLAKEALAFIGFNEESSKVEKINEFLAKFEVINEFENFGLFFEEGIVKLNAIYTMEEIIKATTSVIDLLD